MQNKKTDIKKNIYEEFSHIWDEILINLINDNIIKLNVSCTFLSLKKILIKRLYYVYSMIFMKKYMVKETENIDMHKISACIMKSILIVKPLKISLIDRMNLFFNSKINDERYKTLKNINELLALSTAFSIMNSCIQAKKFSHELVFPIPFIIAEDSKFNEATEEEKKEYQKRYIYDICVDLRSTGGFHFNFVTYANVFFLLEKYSCRYKQCENLEKECRRLLLKYNECSERDIENRIEQIKFYTDKNSTTTHKEQ